MRFGLRLMSTVAFPRKVYLKYYRDYKDNIEIFS